MLTSFLPQNCLLVMMPLTSRFVFQSSNWLKRFLVLGLTVAALPLATLIVSDLPRAIAADSEVAQVTNTRPTLRLGSTGNLVEEIQALLTLLGYYKSPVDGNYQDTTETAVRLFQEDVGLTSDGIVGPATWDKLLPPPSTDLTPPEVVADTTATENDDQADPKDDPVDLPTLRSGMHGPAVASVQETLTTLGLYNGALDGVFGPGTEAAVKAFQRSVDLVDDGIVGPATWGALLRQRS
ncbi:MAG: peptidoglycan-binding protein [Cyanobacteria bacterium P01_F01_bin.86]